MRQYWKEYFNGVNALVFVVDAADEKRLDEVAVQLNICVTNPKLAGVPILVFCNKSDLDTALPPNQIAQRLTLTKIRGHSW